MTDRPSTDQWSRLYGETTKQGTRKFSPIGPRMPAEPGTELMSGMVHDTFDHTSQLRLLKTRFGVPVPNLTPWRRSVTGDMTSTFNFSVPPNSSKPHLDQPFLTALPKLLQCVTPIAPAYLGDGRPYRVRYPQTMPTQGATPTREVPSGVC